MRTRKRRKRMYGGRRKEVRSKKGKRKQLKQ